MPKSPKPEIGSNPVDDPTFRGPVRHLKTPAQPQPQPRRRERPRDPGRPAKFAGDTATGSGLIPPRAPHKKSSGKKGQPTKNA